MAIIKKIGNKARLLPVSATISAPLIFGNPDPLKNGNYNFFSAKIDLFPMVPGRKYFFDKWSFSITADETDFIKGSSALYNLAFYSLLFKATNEAIYARPFRLNKYYSDQEVSAFIFTPRLNDTVQLETTGYIKQVPGMIGDAILYGAFSFNFFEINDIATSAAIENNERS